MYIYTLNTFQELLKFRYKLVRKRVTMASLHQGLIHDFIRKAKVGEEIVTAARRRANLHLLGVRFKSYPVVINTFDMIYFVDFVSLK